MLFNLQIRKTCTSGYYSLTISRLFYPILCLFFLALG